MQVLLVDDDTDVVWGLSRLLGRLSHHVIACHDAKAALAAIDLIQVDLVLLDIELSDTDGYSLAPLLRPNGLYSTPIIAVSSRDDDVERRRAAQIGCHYVKLIGKQHLAAILADVSSDRTSQPA
jgi:DNA-binding response OmpR family regulator